MISAFHRGCRSVACGLPFRAFVVAAFVALVMASASSNVRAQDPRIRYGDPVPSQVKTLFQGGLRYLVDTQREDGSWQSQYGDGPGLTAIPLLAILSSGEDPNYGPYADTIQRGFRKVLRQVHRSTGLIGVDSRGSAHSSMYEHGFCTLALAEAYGVVDDALVWGTEGRGEHPTIGEALELAVGCLITSQNNNPHGAWRYQPNTQDQDTSVSGACLVALLAARNAGIEVPDENMKKALDYYRRATLPDGTVAYSMGGGGGSLALVSISCLVFALAKEKDAPEHQRTLQHLKDNLESGGRTGWPHYTRYYMSQALFQGDPEAWRRWNDQNTENLQDLAREDGCIGQDSFSTSMSLLSMALNYRFLPIYER